ncbi:uncharacterized protein LOC124618173 isoform X8 [Schistocerca americana]|uniref:uncharacterized protein LOC124618173 isoform X8 n=1 Tax=Schistocerca americana TaxID=7009 RepID=UPI001F4F2FE3|nr:uncharacterized protein LOC124618173 isoform X8 [Schistocerca americana]
MSRNRFRTEQLEREVRARPLQEVHARPLQEVHARPLQEVHARPLQGVRASPLHWSEQSDNSSDGDQDEVDGVEDSPHPSVESQQEYEAEDEEPYADYELRRVGGRNRYRESSRSPVLNRRPINQRAAVTEEYRICRESNDSFHPKVYDPEYQNDWKLKYEQNNALKESVQGKDSRNLKMPLTVAFLLVIGSCLVPGTFKKSSSEENSYTGIENMAAAVKNALLRYENIPEDVEFQLSAGIRNVVESDPTKPSIFVLLHNNTGEGPFCLANTIGNLAMKYLESDEEFPLILKPDELLQNENMSRDYGWIIEHYKPLIEKHRSVIFNNLQSFPGRMAMAFHFLCDVENPVVRKALFLFTLRVPNVHSRNVVEQAENVMHNIWREEVDNDQRQALITRLTEDVISLPLNILHNEACP